MKHLVQLFQTFVPYVYLFLNLLYTVVDRGFFPHRYPLISEKKKKKYLPLTIINLLMTLVYGDTVA